MVASGGIARAKFAGMVLVLLLSACNSGDEVIRIDLRERATRDEVAHLFDRESDVFMREGVLELSLPDERVFVARGVVDFSLGVDGPDSLDGIGIRRPFVDADEVRGLVADWHERLRLDFDADAMERILNTANPGERTGATLSEQEYPFGTVGISIVDDRHRGDGSAFVVGFGIAIDCEFSEGTNCEEDPSDG